MDDERVLNLPVKLTKDFPAHVGGSIEPQRDATIVAAMRWAVTPPARFALAGICFLLFALLWLAVSRGWLDSGDRTLMLALHEISSPSLTRAMMAVTIMGGAAVLVPSTIAVAGYLLISGRRRSALALLGVTLGGRLAIIAVKALLARGRPDLFPYIVIDSGSYPSGHAANSTIVLLSIAALTGRRSAYLIALAGAAAIGVSRIYLGVHWPSDILAGLLLGIGWVALCAIHGRASHIAART